MLALPVPADLDPVVAACWVLDGGTVPRGLPQPAVDLLVMPDGTYWLAGPETRRRQGRLPEGGPLVGLRLRPGTVTGLFGLAADEVPLAGTPLKGGHPGGGAVTRTVTRTVAARSAGAFELVRQRRRAGGCRVDERVRAVLAAMHAAPGAPVSRHAAEAGLSERQLRRRFAVAVGLRPKSYARVIRLHHALAVAREALARGERPDWADIAVRSGCYDQPHLLAEFRHAVGTPPATLLADVRFLQSPAARRRRDSDA
ncbi:helix-turn-helix domain-containing protein [Nonomuraea sp. NPDC050783]|uniref:helix-turn-helix domain-containing protein n=1 Tax=Nonomuraea sp. NPDC050783 TaxID=3154634 RepID=UPI00346782F5